MKQQKMKQQKMLKERRCGLKYYDRALALCKNKQEIIDRAIAINKEMPDIWGPGWRNFDWALGNAIQEIINNKNEFQMSFNVNDVLTDEEMKQVADACGFTGQYTQCWPRF